MKNLQDAKNYFGMKISYPNKICIKGNRYEDWKRELESLNDQRKTKIILLLLPGQKGKGQYYNEIKRFTLSQMQVPTQVVLSTTISKGKNLRSIITKVLMQINAKVGGEPWAMDKMPFVDMPTCVISVDYYEKGPYPVMGVCLTLNKTFSKYACIALPKNSPDYMTQAIEVAFNTFARTVGVEPKSFIILRDGVSPSKAKEIGMKEIDQIKNYLSNCKSQKYLTYIMLNKKSNLKIYNFNTNNKTYEGCQPGTVVDDHITNNDPKNFKEFYMISQLVRQGCAGVTHYNILYNDREPCTKRHIELFMYKLCHLYYNWAGGIKVPAPCQYSRRLAYMIGEKLTERDRCHLPGKNLWEGIKSLYML